MEGEIMDRRTFIKTSIVTTAGVGLSRFSDVKASQKFSNDRPLINAYYFRAHMYTIVPHQIREDLKWMADIGTDVVSIAVLEQDLFAAVQNIDIICNEAAKVGIKVFATPSRWAGIVAGAPKCPSMFSVRNPHTWVLGPDGKPNYYTSWGVMSSIHYPEVYEFFCQSVDEVLRLWDIKGIIWDEPKSFREDFSPKAIENLGKDVPFKKHVPAVCDFYSRVNTHIKKNHPDIITNFFAYAELPDFVINTAAQIKHLDYFGCDGRPWRNEDGGVKERVGKVLLGAEAGERFLIAAEKNNKKSLMLIENHNLETKDNVLMDKRLPEVLNLKADQFIYYYYPRNLENPEETMAIIKKHFTKMRKKC